MSSAPRTQVICMASVKGGSGKTVLAATFAAILAAIGKRVLLVDTDAATNGLTLLYLNEVVDHREALELEEPRRSPAGTYELPGRRSPTPEFVQLAENRYLLPATYEFFDSETVDLDAYTASLRDATERWRGSFDFVFLDAQAGSDGFAHGAMRREISDKVILVSEYDPLSAAGIERLKALFPEDLAYERIWILLNKMLPDIAARYGEFLEVARYLPPVTWNADVVRAYSRRSLALDLEHGNEYTVAACQTLAALLDPHTEIELQKWLSEKAAELRIPLEIQIHDLRSEITALDKASERATRRQALLGTVVAGALGVVAVAGVVGILSSGQKAPLTTALVLSVLGGLVALLIQRISLRSRETWIPARQDDLTERLAALEALGGMDDRDLVGKAVPSDVRGLAVDPRSD